MTEGVLTSDRILDAAEQVLARFGPQKTTVVDVARALGVSHGSVYRHFASKAVLRDAVTERWLARVDRPLAKIAAENAPAPDRLRRWFDTLIAIKRQKARAEPELFATYRAILADSPDAIRHHVDALVGQIAAIVTDGIRRREFAPLDPDATGRAIFHATARFHAPVHAGEWSDPQIDEAFDSLWSLIIRGLAAASTTKTTPRRKRS